MRSLAKILVVGLIAVVGGGLLAAGVMKIRQAAGRTDCRSNLRTLGLALHDYHDTYGHFPAATFPGPPKDAPGSPGLYPQPAEVFPPERRFSWLVGAASYLSQSEFLFQLDLTRPWDSPENCPVRERQILSDEHGEQVGERIVEAGEIRTFRCPENPNRAGPGMPGMTHYVGIAGVGEDAVSQQPYDSRAGVFGYDRCTSLKDIQRGTGHTLAVMETAWQNGPWTAGGPPTTRGLVPGPQPYLGAGGQFGGSHPGGGWALFADGSVRFLADSVNPTILEDLVTIRGGSHLGEE